MLVEQLMALRNVPVVEICDPEIQENIKKEREIQHFKVEPVIKGAYYVLNVPVDGKNPDRLD